MTIPELKAFFQDKTFTPPIQITPDQIVSDPVQFLHTQFIMVEQWPEKKPLDRCPAYLRLMKFWEVVKYLVKSITTVSQIISTITICNKNKIFSIEHF